MQSPVGALAAAKRQVQQPVDASAMFAHDDERKDVVMGGGGGGAEGRKHRPANARRVDRMLKRKLAEERAEHPDVKARREKHERARMRASDADEMLRQAGLMSSVAAPLMNPNMPSAPNGVAVDGEGETVKREEKPELSAQQQRTLEMALAGRNVFITGSAGVGKSLLVDSIVEQLRKMGKEVAITASTGIAAVNVGGCTLHAFAGIGLGEATAPILAKQAGGSKFKRKKWCNTQVLVIDEVSMISQELFDKVSYVGRFCRGPGTTGRMVSHIDEARHLDPRPFGGLQIIAVGDFFQLPPVERSGRQVAFAFESKTWRECNFINCVLQRVFRQSDREFIGVLEHMRHGRIPPQTLEVLRRCNRPLDESDGIRPTVLYPHRASVNHQNLTEFAKLDGPTEVYNAKEGGKEAMRYYLKDVQAQPTQELKVGAQVVLLTNLDLSRRLCNGSRGLVVGFEPIAAWKTIESGSPKTAAGSRALDEWVQAHEFVPRVRFDGGVERIVGPHVWEKTISNDTVARAQVPLAFAWALTVHKCQGMSLDRVRVALAEAFAEGMVYVALSRARGLGGLHIESFNPNAVRAHPKVSQFYSTLLKTNIGGGEDAGEAAEGDESQPSQQLHSHPSHGVQQQEQLKQEQREMESEQQLRQLELQRQQQRQSVLASFREGAREHAIRLLRSGADPSDEAFRAAMREQLVDLTKSAFGEAENALRRFSSSLGGHDGGGGGGSSQRSPIVLSDSPH